MGKSVTAFALLAALAVAGCTTTQENTGAETNSQYLTTDELRALLPGKTVTYPTLGRTQAVFGPEGSYEFRGRSGTSTGTYFFEDNRFCRTFSGSGRRCNRVINRGDAYFLEGRSGRLFRMQIRG